jgi:tRNA-Thr(GGU) m(6)t(6)A37 methyltransferase TsaA
LKSIQLLAIGKVRCKFTEAEIKRKRGSIVSKIIIDKRYSKALDGIDAYSHLFVIFFLHKVPLRETRVHKIHPRGRVDIKKVGVFATRSRSHPNRIGLAVVKLLKRRGNSLKVQALDALDGTPVLDIKPYDHIDVQKRIHVPDWWHKLQLRS